jgi:hypothetical protein
MWLWFDLTANWFTLRVLAVFTGIVGIIGIIAALALGLDFPARHSMSVTGSCASLPTSSS